MDFPDGKETKKIPTFSTVVENVINCNKIFKNEVVNDTTNSTEQKSSGCTTNVGITFELKKEKINK